jgi:transposase
MIVVSNEIFENALVVYRRRWEIETMFGCLKTRGFQMEDTHITDADKIERLIFVLAIAFCWAYRIGDIKEKKEPIAIKAHGRKAKSYFRRGSIKYDERYSGVLHLMNLESC